MQCSNPQLSNHAMRRFRPYGSTRYRNPWKSVSTLVIAVFRFMLLLLVAIGTVAGVLGGMVAAAWRAARKR